MARETGLRGKVVIVTGGAAGIGRATALRFAATMLGLSVALGLTVDLALPGLAAGVHAHAHDDGGLLGEAAAWALAALFLVSFVRQGPYGFLGKLWEDSGLAHGHDHGHDHDHAGHVHADMSASAGHVHEDACGCAHGHAHEPDHDHHDHGEDHHDHDHDHDHHHHH